ncbi:MAG: ATP synthase F0 subunit B [Candidatus Eremiobacterota bacterium]
MTPENTFTWVVSLINFSIVYVLFKSIVIDPMKKAVAEREANTRKRLDEAESLLQDALKHKQQYETLLVNLDARTKEIVDHAREASEDIRKGRDQEADRDARFLLEKARHEADLMRRQVSIELKLLAAERSVDRARVLLDQHLDADNRKSILQSFVERVGLLNAS